jgi:hypothetical protein
VPAAKLHEFRKEQARLEGTSGNPRRKLRSLRSNLSDPSPFNQLVLLDKSEDEGVISCSSDEDDEPEVLAFLEAKPLCIGSGVVVGAEAVIAHAKRLGKTIGATESVIISTMGPAEKTLVNQPAPSTPQRLPVSRELVRNYSDPKNPDPRRPKRSAPSKYAAPIADEVASEGKLRDEEPESSQTHLESLLESFGVPSWGRTRLLPLVKRWGHARVSQVLGLWTFLGDGRTKPVSVPNMHVWGPSGSGKTSILFDFLDTLEIQSIWINCACFTFAGELQALIVELLRRTAVEASRRSGAPELPKELRRRTPHGRQLRALDKIDLAIRPPLDYLLESGYLTKSASTPVKIVVVLDNAQELPRLGPGMADVLTSLPEVLQQGNQLAVCTVSRLPLSCHGLINPARDPASVIFEAYTRDEASIILSKELAKNKDQHCLAEKISTGLIQFAVPHLGLGLHDLLSVGQELLRDADVARTLETKHSKAQLHARVEQAVECRLGLGNVSGFLRPSEQVSKQDMAEHEASKVAAKVAMQRLTNAEKRLVLSSYLASRIDKEDDVQFFLPGRAKRNKRSTGVNRRSRLEDAQPSFTRPPRPVPLARVLAIYHKLANAGKGDTSNLIGASLFGHIARLREFGYIRLDRAGQENDTRVLCRVELPLVFACARELDVQLTEYLHEH